MDHIRVYHIRLIRASAVSRRYPATLATVAIPARSSSVGARTASVAITGTVAIVRPPW